MAIRHDRKSVVTAAAELVDREGLDGLSLSSVASSLGMHVSSLYNHVSGADEIRHAVATRALEELGEVLWQGALGRSGTEAIDALARVYHSYVAEHPERYKAVLFDQRHSPEHTAARSRVAAAIEGAMISFGFNAVEAVHAHRIFSSVIIGFVTRYEFPNQDQGTLGDEIDAPLADTFEMLVQLLNAAFSTIHHNPAQGDTDKRDTGRRLFEVP